MFKISATDVSSMVTHFVQLLNKKPEFRQTFTMVENGVKVDFGFIPNLEKMSYGEYIDLDTYMGDVSTYHKAMAVMFRPIKEKHKDKYTIIDYQGTEEFSEVMKYAPLDICISATLFFWNLKNQLLNAIPDYLERKTKEAQRVSMLNPSLSIDGDGIAVFFHSLGEMCEQLSKSQDYHSLFALPHLITKQT